MVNVYVDYVCIVIVKGLLWFWVVMVYILCNLLILVVIFLGVDLGVLMGGVIVIEGIFNIYGVGGVLY